MAGQVRRVTGHRPPLRNRGTPLGEIVSDPARGLVYGNRGCLHGDGSEPRRRYDGRRWIACRLRFRGWQRPALMMPGRFTELFFLDEVTAMAAGHRACALCRREDYNRLREHWRELHPGQVGADAIDLQLHHERVGPGGVRRCHEPISLSGLPDGAFVLLDNAPWLVLGGDLVAWTPAGYTEHRPRRGRRLAEPITPPSLLALLRAGWEPLVPLIHPSARS